MRHKTSVSKRRSARYRQTQPKRELEIELKRIKTERDMLMALAKERPLFVSEGKELNRLATRVRRIEHKLERQGKLATPIENDSPPIDDQDIPS